MQERKELVWVRSDLRVSDNKALYHASCAGNVVVVFLVFTKQWRDHNDSQNKLWFVWENLQELKKQLNDLNIPLICMRLSRYCDAATCLVDMAKKLGGSAIWFNDEYGVNEEARDKSVLELSKKEKITCHRFTDQVLCKPGLILNGNGEFFKVFTPFKKALYRQLNTQAIKPLPAPQKQMMTDFAAIDCQLPENPFQPLTDYVKTFWRAGELAAQKKLALFIEHKITAYLNDRDYPELSGTSSLSPWLTVGAISIRQCFYAALMANQGELDTGSEGVVCWLSELVWREFYRHVVVGFPRVAKTQAFNQATDALPWKQDAGLFAVWQQGKTGFPIVDAAMRQLVATGWMHNRMRMVTAMFLSKDLMLDWRLGERFFMEHLIDGDLASNNGGWQWSASTGTDAVPYFRMFNPTRQSLKFDPDGVFIKQWLPELRGLSGLKLHEPYRQAGQADLLLGYPEPVVDHARAREQVLTVFKALK